MKLFAAFILAIISIAAHGDPFAGGNAMTGAKVFDERHCNICHMRIAGGDGNGIFTRPNHIVGSAAQLVDQMNTCTGNAGITLTKQDEQDLGAYLNQSYYHFK